MDKNSSKQMQIDTLLMMCTKNLLLKLFVFTTHRGYKCFLNKCGTLLYAGCLPKVSSKTKLFSLLTVDIFFSEQKQNDSLLTAGTKKLLLKLSSFKYLRWIENFFKQRQDGTLLNVCYKKLLLKVICFYYSESTKTFCKQL